MFDFVRKHTKWMMLLMFLLIIPAFVLVGVDGFKSISAGGESVAKVGSYSIKQIEWDNAHKVEVDRLRGQYPNVDVKMFDTPQIRYGTLEKLVRERVLTEAAQSAHLITTDARLAAALQQDPTIAMLRKPDGSLDMDRYRQLAAMQGTSPEGFEAKVRNDLSQRQVEFSVAGTALAPAGLANVSLNAFFERREVQIARFAAGDYAGKVNLTDADVQSYYDANTVQFQAPETATVEYLVLDLESVKKTITLNEADVKSYYEQNVARLSGKEERRASHILINAPKEMAAADRQKARARAEELLAQVRKAPESFADVARKNSQDTGSASNGGDLDFFGRGAMVKAFEDAVFALKKGEISDVVESDFGFHIIKLTDLKSPKPKTFEELRAGIEADLKAQQAQRKYAEIAEVFTNGVYEQSDALKPIAEKLKLEVRTASGIQRKPLPGAQGPLANAKLLAAIFSSDSIEKKRNTEAIDIGPSQLASARITQYTAARTLPLAEVRGNVRDRLIASRSAELAKKDGEEKLTAWKQDGKDAKLAEAVVVSRDRSQPLAGPILDAVMRANTETLPSWVGVDLGAQGYAVVRVNKVLPRNDVADATAKQERNQFAQWLAGAESQAYYALLKERFKVKINVPRPSSNVEATKE